MEPGSHTIDREKLILGCEDQVKLLARKMACRLPGLHIYDDLLSVAWIGAIKAVDRFEPGAGKLSTYVGFKVRGAILDYLRSLDPLKREHRQLVKKSVGTNFMHVEVNPEMRDPRPDFSDQVITAMSIKKLLKNAKLTEKEYLVVCLWSQDYNMVSLAEKFRVHQSRISQINKNAIKKIRRVVFP